MPKVTPYVNPITVVEELPARISCRVQGFPTPDVSWYYAKDISKRPPETPVQIAPNEKHVVNTQGGERDNSYNATLTVCKFFYDRNLRREMIGCGFSFRFIKQDKTRRVTIFAKRVTILVVPIRVSN